MACCVFFGFGWARPVEINPLQFRNYKKGLFLTSIAGVCVNLILAFIGCGLYYGTLKIILTTGVAIESNMFLLFVYYFTYFLFQINICLFIFNLLPIYPLDGFNAISVFTKYENKFVNFMRQYGNIILIILLVFGDSLLFWLCSWVGWPIEMLWSLIL
jgi:Zn-dependent protease